MAMGGQLKMDIPVVRPRTSEVRHAVDQAMAAYAEPLRRAAQMVASELVENAIKYGQHTPELAPIRFVLSLSEQDVTIEVANDIDDRAALAILEARVAAINESADREELLLNRMQEIIDRSTQDSQLGLYRIASEGGFHLEYSYNVSVLTVRATRKIYG